MAEKPISAEKEKTSAEDQVAGEEKTATVEKPAEETTVIPPSQPAPGLTQENLDVLKFEKTRELINWLTVILIFSLPRLPLNFKIDQQILIYLASFFIAFTVFWYHLVPKKYATKSKVTIGVFIYSFFTAILLHFTGGFQSPLSFLILIPLIASVWGLGPKALLIPIIIFFAFFGIELKFFPIGTAPERAENTIHLFTLTASLLGVGLFVYRLGQREHDKDLEMIRINLRLIQDEKMLREILEEAIGAKQKLESTNVELEKTKFNLVQTLQNITVPGRKIKFGPSIKEMKEDTGATLELISHRLNAPVTVIQGNIDMLLEGNYGKLKPEQESVLKDISAGNDRLRKIIADFISFLTLRGAPREPIFTVNLPPAIEAAIAHVSPRAKEKNIQIIYQPTDLGITVEGNSERITNAMINIFDSCLLSCPAGSKISIVHYRQKNDVIIEITHQNMFIPKENWERVFQQFQAAEHILAGTAESTGLELHLARSFARLMGGDVFIVRSEPDVGTTLVFKLKAAKYMVTPKAEKAEKKGKEEKEEIKATGRLERLKQK